MDNVKQKIPQNVSDIREKTLARLIAENIPFLETLPDIDIDKEKLRSKEEVLSRLISLIIVCAKAFGCTSKEIDKYTNKFKDAVKFTPKERKFLNSEKPTEQQRINFCWKIEAAKPLAWALGLIEDIGSHKDVLNPDVFWNFINNFDYKQLESKSKLRDKKEILELLDFIYNVHWTLVEERLGNIQMPESLESEAIRDIIPEWHYGLNWLSVYDDVNWDDITTDT
ncbi:MAG: DUF4272 domain-containing protein [Candidatus Dojkabacteria bacterium]|nr:DUF4272 domain-containing protein [Candidatus Dojkabacteria bacterium]